MTVAGPVEGLDRLPDRLDGHLWADYWELACLVNLDLEFSRADFLDVMRELKDVGEPTLEGDADPGSFADPSGRDKMKQRVDDFLLHLEYRADRFGDAYPFMVNGSFVSAEDELNDGQELYIFTLLSANLRYVAKSEWSLLTESFEMISESLLEQLLPDKGETRLFGSGDDYEGNLVTKIQALAEDLNEEFAADPDEFAPQNVGDAGLDVVGWVPPGDEAPGRVLLFGQCACTEEWKNKQYTASPRNWRSYISFTADPLNLTFIPHCYRSATGSWHRKHEISNSVVLDRVRIVHHLGNTSLTTLLNSDEVPNLANSVLEQADAPI